MVPLKYLSNFRRTLEMPLNFFCDVSVECGLTKTTHLFYFDVIFGIMLLLLTKNFI